MRDPNPRHRVLPAAFVLTGLALVAAIYGRGLHAPFVFDDVVFVDSPIVHITSVGQLPAIVSAPGIPRKLTMVTFALNFRANELRPFGYHLVNVALHAIAGGLVFLLGRRLMRRADDWWWQEHATRIAGLGALLWLVHPVHTQAVVYTWQRSTVLCTVFYLGALLCYVAGRERAGRVRWAWWIPGLVLAAAALMTKEIAATLPAAAWLVERRFFTVARRARPWLTIVAVTGLGVIAMDYLGPRFASMIETDFARRGFTPLERLLTESRVVVYYIGLLLFPHPSRLMVDYDVALSRSLWSPATTAPAVALIAMALALAAWWWRRRPLASFAVLWFLGHLVIESTIIPLDLAYEHRVYLPSTIPFVIGAGLIWRVVGTTRAGWIAVALLCSVLSVWSAMRVEVWRDPVRLWRDNAEKTPNKARVLGQLGKACLGARDRDCAWRSFTRAVALDPSLVSAENGLASVLIDIDGDLTQAERVLQSVLARKPDYVPALVNLGVAQLRRRQPAAAFETLSRAVRVEPNDRLVLFNLASAALAIARFDAAHAAADRGVHVWPREASFLALRGLAALGDGHLADAAADATRAQALDPADPLVTELLKRLKT